MNVERITINCQLLITIFIHLEILDDIYFSKHKYSKELRMVKMVRDNRC